MAEPEFEVILRTGDTVARRLVAAGDYSIGRSTLCAWVAENPELEEEHAFVSVSAAGVRVKPCSTQSEIRVGTARVKQEQELNLPASFSLRNTQVEISAMGPGQTLAPRDAQSSTSAIEVEHYEIHGEIAAGGMGRVLDAEDLKLGRTVAMKVLHEREDADLDLEMRFVQEAEIMGWLEHPNIVPIHDFGKDARGRPYYTMKRVQGETLQAVLNKLKTGEEGALRDWPLNNLLNVFLKVCDAVAFAHSKGVIHRDLKPENVMLGDFGEVLVMDWGLARLESAESDESGGTNDIGREADGITLDGAVIGTPQFMPPEQALGRRGEIDARSDIYSLGAILYAILTLQAPARGKSVREVLEQSIRGEIVPPSELSGGPRKHCPRGRAPDSLSSVAMKALSPDPVDRYSEVAKLAADVRAYLGGFATSAEEVSATRQLALWIGRNRVAAAAAAIILALSVAFMYRLILSEREAQSQKTAALEQQRNAEAAAQRERAAREKEKATRRQSDLWLADTYLNFGLEEMAKENHGRAQLWFTLAAEKCVSDPKRHHANLLRAKLCSLQPGHPVRFIPGVPGSSSVGQAINQLTLHPVRPIVVTRARINQRRIIDLATETYLHPEARKTDFWHSVAFHPHEPELFAACWDNSEIELRSFVDNRARHMAVLPVYGPLPRGLVFSPDARRLFAGDQSAWIYDFERRTVIEPRFYHESYVSDAGFNPDGNRVWTLTYNGRFRVLKAEPGLTEKPHWGPIDQRVGLTELQQAPQYVNGGRELLLNPGQGDARAFLRYHDAETGKLLREVKYGPQGATEVNPELGLAVGYHGLMELATGKFRGENNSGPARIVADGDRFICRTPEGIQLFRTGDGSLVRTLSRTPQLTKDVIADAELNYFVHHDADHAVYSRRLQDYPWVRTIWEAPAGARGRFNPDGGKFVVMGRRQPGQPVLASQVFSATNGQALGPPMKPGGAVVHAEFTSDSKLVVILASAGPVRTPRTMFDPDGRSGNVQFWDWRKGERVSPVLPMPAEPRSAAVHSAVDWIAVICANGALLRIDPADWSVATLIPGIDVNNPVSLPYEQVRFTAEGDKLLAWGTERFVHVWNVAKGKPQFPPIRTEARRIAHGAAGAGRLILTTRYDGGSGSGIYDLDTGKELDSPLGEDLGYDNVELSADGQFLLANRYEGGHKTFLWDLDRGELNCPMRTGEPGPSAFVPGTDAIITVGQPGQIVIWDRNSGQLLGPPIRMETEAAAARREHLQVAPDGRSALFTGARLHLLDLSPLRESPDLGLTDADRRLLAEINAEAALVEGRLATIELASRWKEFRSKHPEFHALQPNAAQRRRWHEMRMSDVRLLEPPGFATNRTYRWHQQQLARMRQP